MSHQIRKQDNRGGDGSISGERPLAQVPKGLSEEMVLEPRSAGREGALHGKNWVEWGGDDLGRGNSQCKSPGIRPHLTCWRNS